MHYAVHGNRVATMPWLLFDTYAYVMFHMWHDIIFRWKSKQTCQIGEKRKFGTTNQAK